VCGADVFEHSFHYLAGVSSVFGDLRDGLVSFEMYQMGVDESVLDAPVTQQLFDVQYVFSSVQQ